VFVSTARELYQLQQVDSERADKDHRLAEVQGALGESDDLIRAREGVSETEAGLGKLRQELRVLELEISSVESKLKQNQDRLYGGRVRNPKELSSLQEEAAALRRRCESLEEDQLDLMIAIEEEEAELAERQARLRQIETSWHKEQVALRAEKDELELRLLELDEEREARRARIGAADLALYDDLCDRYGGVGVVLLKRGICQVCGVDVPTGVARAVERGEGVYYCPTCNRMLFGGG
jgi:predicted  nucleic acid-binding Zn-ribbon protein